MEFREELKHGKVSALKGVLWTLAIVAVIFFGLFATAFLRFWLGINWPQFVLYGGVVVIGFFLIKYRMTDYVYVVQKGKVYFGRKVGAREKELFSMPVRDIAAMGPYAAMQGRIAGKKLRKFTFCKKSETFVLDAGDVAILLSPTQELKERLEDGS